MAEPDTITLRRTYKFRLDVTPAQAERLEWTLRRCCRLYNELLAERRDCYRWFGVSLSRNDQINRLPAFKQEHPEYVQIGSQVLQDVAKRVDRAFAGFFRRVREGARSQAFRVSVRTSATTASPTGRVPDGSSTTTRSC